MKLPQEIVAARPVRGAFERLEPRAGKLARGVLRGRAGGNAALLPDQPTGLAALMWVVAFSSSWGVDILRSEDGGDTWQVISETHGR